MPDTSVGNVYVNVIPRVEGDSAALGQSVGKKFSGGLTGAAAAGAVAVGGILADAAESAASSIGEQLSKTLWNYADYEQLVGGVDTLFKDASQAVQENAKQAFQTAGMSANQYMEQVTSFSASLIQSLDGDTQKAASVADQAITDMSDNANKMGTDINRITDAYQGFAKQNYTMLDNLKLGYGGTKTEMERLLQDAGKIANTEFNIDSYSDVIEAIHVIQESMDITGTTMEEGSKTISGSLNQLQGAWDNFLTAIGDGGRTMDLSAVTDGLITSLGAVAMNIVPAIARIGETIVFELPTVIAQSFMEAEPAMIAAIGETFGASGQQAAIQFFDQLNAGFAQIGELLTVIFGDVQSIITQAVEALLPVVQPLVETLGAVIGNAAMVILRAIAQVTGFLAQDVMPTVTDVVGQIMPIVTDLLTFIGQFAVDVENFIGDAFELVLALATDVWPDVDETITTALDDVSGVVSAVLDGIKAAFTSAFGAVKNITSAAFPVVANVIKTAVSTAKSVVETATGGIKRAFDGIRGVAATVKGIFDRIQKAMSDPINTAKNTISGAINKIESIISGAHLQLPHIPMPEFHVSGGSIPWGIGGQGSPPNFWVTWKAKGGFANTPTLAGYGEKGTEFFWPGYEPYFDKYAKGIAKHLDGANGGVTVNATINGVESAEDAVEQLTVEIKRLKAAGVF